MSAAWTFEPAAGPYGGLTEGPAWDGSALLFSHIPGNRTMRYDPATGACTEFRINTEGTNGLAFDRNGVLYGCCQRGRSIVRFESDGSLTHLPDRLDGRKINRPNDLAIDSKGRIWFTDPCHNVPADKRELDHGSVLRLAPNAEGGWTLERMTTDTRSPNGIALSHDERTLYVAESGFEREGVRELRAYPIRDDDTLGDFTVLHTFGKDVRGIHRGVDGMCLDADGNIVACAGWPAAGPGPLIYVFAPSGRVLETRPVPFATVSEKPTNCAFGGADMDMLFVTTGEGFLYRVRDSGRHGRRR